MIKRTWFVAAALILSTAAVSAQPYGMGPGMMGGYGMGPGMMEGYGMGPGMMGGYGMGPGMMGGYGPYHGMMGGNWMGGVEGAIPNLSSDQRAKLRPRKRNFGRSSGR
ncbi:MAG TPA: hypothetical protein VJ652_07020 [Noviherbaspirillum sp.]|nr:hypothetical protein [Noviherbaspirillum sp.]